MRDLYGRVPERKTRSDNSDDTALIIALIILLIKEGADSMIILALLYILA